MSLIRLISLIILRDISRKAFEIFALSSTMSETMVFIQRKYLFNSVFIANEFRILCFLSFIYVLLKL